MDYAEKILNALSNPDHIVLVGLGLFGLYLFAKHIFPRMLRGELHLFFNNGGGELVKGLVRKELEDQDERIEKTVRTALRDHVETCRYRPISKRPSYEE